MSLEIILKKSVYDFCEKSILIDKSVKTSGLEIKVGKVSTILKKANEKIKNSIADIGNAKRNKIIRVGLVVTGGLFLAIGIPGFIALFAVPGALFALGAAPALGIIIAIAFLISLGLTTILYVAPDFSPKNLGNLSELTQKLSDFSEAIESLNKKDADACVTLKPAS